MKLWLANIGLGVLLLFIAAVVIIALFAAGHYAAHDDPAATFYFGLGIISFAVFYGCVIGIERGRSE